jgi:hypothetical protein
VSALCGIASATWTTWEQTTRPRDKTDAVDRIARASGYDAAWLMWGGPPIPEFPLRR